MAKTYEAIATNTLGSSAASFNFTSIPSTYTDLILVIRYAGTSNDQNSLLRFNGDTGSNYSRTFMLSGSSGTASGRNSNQTFIQMVQNMGAGTSLDSGNYHIVQIMNYANTTNYKTMLDRTYAQNNSGTQAELLAFVGLWRSTSAINQITYSQGGGDILAGSSATLYGIKAA